MIDDNIAMHELHREFHENFLQTEHKKIIFSGRFGSGKTFYLQDFFEKSEFKEYYNCVHLFPIYYSISSNADILKLIENDIFIELLKQNIVQEKVIEKFSYSLLLYNYLTNYLKVNFEKNINILSVFFPVSEMIDKVLQTLHLPEGAGTVLLNLLKNFKENPFKKFKDIQKKVQEDYDFTEIQKLIDENKSNLGSIHGQSIYQAMLCEILQSTKKDENNPKKNILIIDDLDRIDPAHIFRILNIFSASLKAEQVSNLLGFDQIILVCHEENIRSIYHYFYGSDTDYQGYMAKFQDLKYDYKPEEIFIKEVKKILTPVLEKIYQTPLLDGKITDVKELKEPLEQDLRNFSSLLFKGFSSKTLKIEPKTIREILKIFNTFSEKDFQFIQNLDICVNPNNSNPLSISFPILHVFYSKCLGLEDQNIDTILNYYNTITLEINSGSPHSLAQILQNRNSRYFAKLNQKYQPQSNIKTTQSFEGISNIDQYRKQIITIADPPQNFLAQIIFEIEEVRKKHLKN